MIITREEVSGYVTCGRDRLEDGPCEGYTSRPIQLVKEVVTKTFGDFTQDPADPFFAIPSISHEYLHTTTGEPPLCSLCGSAANLSLEPRPRYRRLSDKGPEELVRIREMERARDARETESLDAATRQAVALEQLAAGQPSPGADELAALRAEIAELRQQLDGNGHAERRLADDAASRPSRKATSR